MIRIINNAATIFPMMAFGKKKEDTVDKGTNRDIPGNSEGARPPRKEEYKNSEGKKKKNSSEDSEPSKKNDSPESK
ncbi:hypothetical protein SAMN00777080_4070 [Aquiflexum balticum DSM 16537]|uniref:Uncharacterized protein n=2 Tax=Aquiflexum TaxID=280472 RepID=A0A1W2H978_9BACT|nr:hypothetical protein SAMN00777080_4070 [Aquiflexum balticum DSM 16537]